MRYTSLKKDRRENKMEAKKLASCIIFALIVCSFAAHSSLVLAQPAGEGAKATTQNVTKISVKGKIHFDKTMGGYYVQGEEPVGAFFIVNQNIPELKKHVESKKTILIDGHLTIGADHLFIEKINGKNIAAKITPR
jgi:hypothetical protein